MSFEKEINHLQFSLLSLRFFQPKKCVREKLRIMLAEFSFPRKIVHKSSFFFSFNYARFNKAGTLEDIMHFLKAHSDFECLKSAS